MGGKCNIFFLVLKCFIIGAAELALWSVYNLTDVQTHVPVVQQRLLYV